MKANSPNAEYFAKVNELELAVVRNVRQFPMRAGKDMVTPNMVVCVNHRGTFKALYDLKEIEFGANEIAVVLPNHVMRPLWCSDDYQVTLIVLSGAFVNEFAQRMMSHDHSKYHTSPACRLTEEQMEKVNKIIDATEVISNMTVKQIPHRHMMLLYIADVGFELLNSVRRSQDKVYVDRREITVFNHFCDLLAQYYTEHHDAGFYAAQLHLSTQHFSKLIEQAVGISASGWIKQYLATQAKQILSSRPDMNVQQLTYLLGFSEPAGFCRFFKSMTGLRPREYREQALGVKSSDTED